MADHISREAAVKVLTRIGTQVSDSRRRAVAKCINEIELLPAADVEPVKRAWWIDEEGVIVCSNCGAGMEITDSFGEENHRNYCPNCGAKMDGGVEIG